MRSEPLVYFGSKYSQEFSVTIHCMKTAILLMAHGSRQDEANADLHYMVAELRQRERDTIVEASFLELAEPNIEQGAAQCVAHGAAHVILLPYFLSAGIHVRRDLTDIQRRLSERYPTVTFSLAEALGRHPLLVEVVCERIRQAQTAGQSDLAR